MYLALKDSKQPLLAAHCEPYAKTRELDFFTEIQPLLCEQKEVQCLWYKDMKVKTQL